MASLKKTKSKKHQILIDEGTLNYYKRVSQTFNDGFPADNERDVFLDNVFDQLEEDVIRVCRCPQTSPIVEDLVAAASLSHINKIFHLLHKNWHDLCVDQSASHVLERAISVLPKFIAKSISDTEVMASVKHSEDEDETVSDIVRIIRQLVGISDLMMENLDVILTHVYSSHVLRTLLQVLGGASVGESVLKSRTSRKRSKEVHTEQKKQDFKFTDYPVPPLFLKKLKRFAKQIFKADSFSVFLTDPIVSPVIQTLLLVLHKNDLGLCQKYIHKVIKHSRIKDVEKVDNPELIKLPPVALDSVGSFLVELVLTLTSGETFRELYEELFQGRLLHFSVHPKANYVLQRLISSCKEKEMYKQIFDEVSPHLEDVLAANHFGVAVALAEACQKLGTRQDKYRNLLMSAFHCLEPEDRQIKFVTLLASFSTYEIFFEIGDGSEDKTKEQNDTKIPILTTFNYHGTLLLQHLLKFGNPKPTVISLLDLKPAELRNMSCDPCGSHVIESFFMAEGVGEKSKDTLLNKLRGLYVDLACHKNGSRTLETIWKLLSIKQKTQVAMELCKQEVKVRSDRFGCYMYRNFALQHFVKRRNDWLGIQESDMRKRKLFKDFLDDKTGADISPTKRTKWHSKFPRSVSEEANADDGIDRLKSQETEPSESTSVVDRLFQTETVFKRKEKRQYANGNKGQDRNSSFKRKNKTEQSFGKHKNR